MIDESVLPFLSNLERKVYDWLTKKNIPFGMQDTMFGQGGEVGTSIVDFVIPDRNLAFRVMGSYYHSTFEAKARDMLGKERLISAGYQVVDLWEADLADNKISHTIQLALQGQEIPR